MKKGKKNNDYLKKIYEINTYLLFFLEFHGYIFEIF
jgi:hypothetical protein